MNPEELKNQNEGPLTPDRLRQLTTDAAIALKYGQLPLDLPMYVINGRPPIPSLQELIDKNVRALKEQTEREGAKDIPLEVFLEKQN